MSGKKTGTMSRRSRRREKGRRRENDRRGRSETGRKKTENNKIEIIKSKCKKTIVGQKRGGCLNGPG